jgi:glutamate-1-semialdehyde 2,1-aminomutase
MFAADAAARHGEEPKVVDPLGALEQELLEVYRSRTPASRALYERAQRVMPGGDTRTGTFFLPYPLFLEGGAGSRVWDADGHEYLDLLSNFTSLIHGHAHPRIVAAITEQAGKGTAHGSAGELQVRLAELLTRRIPSLEQVRFCNSGTEATLGAIRAARAFTGRPMILKMEGSYHGSHDVAAVGGGSQRGLSPASGAEVLSAAFNDLAECAELIRKHRDRLAAVIVEPVMGAGGCIPAQPAFLAGLRGVTAECGALLIFDEVITLRLATGGAQERYGVRPDLTCLGKLIGGGLPIGAFGGRADIMAAYDPTRPDPIGHSGTYNGNAETMAAGIVALELLTAERISQINEMGDALRGSLQSILAHADIGAAVTGMGSLLQVHFAGPPVESPRDAARSDRRLVRLLHLALLGRGVFSATRQLYVVSTTMDGSDIARFTSAFEDATARLAEALHESANAR